MNQADAEEYSHVVILGAGASRATLSHPAYRGHQIPVMNDFINLPEISELLKKQNIVLTNIEEIYCYLEEKGEWNTINELELIISNEIQNYYLPDEITIYDLLFLCLGPNDCILSFNWDSLLLQARDRVIAKLASASIKTKLPNFFFLHGNVTEGECQSDSEYGRMGKICGKCQRPFSPVKLIYPTSHKDYSSDFAIKNAWEAARYFMSKAMAVTIFGYSAPKSDVAAISLLEKAWGKPKERFFANFEIIDIKPHEELVCCWKSFVFSEHLQSAKDFYDSTIARFPRKTVEAALGNVSGRWIDSSPVSQTMSWDEVLEFLRPVLASNALKNRFGRTAQ
ncbi:MAG: hypothetical protein IKS83_09040 [Victivallales bacterium]|nr:hypothetical protein [Victivallales bacterium]